MYIYTYVHTCFVLNHFFFLSDPEICGGLGCILLVTGMIFISGVL